MKVFCYFFHLIETKMGNKSYRKGDSQDYCWVYIHKPTTFVVQQYNIQQEIQGNGDAHD